MDLVERVEQFKPVFIVGSLVLALSSLNHLKNKTYDNTQSNDSTKVYSIQPSFIPEKHYQGITCQKDSSEHKIYFGSALYQ